MTDGSRTSARGGTARTSKANGERASRAKTGSRGIGRPPGSRGIGRDVLVEKTIELMRVLPPEKLSLTAAANHAKVHLTLFKYYFKDRTRLLVDVARHLAMALGEMLKESEQGDMSPRARLRLRIDALVDFYFLNPFYHRLMIEILADDNDPLAGELINLWMSYTLEIYREIMNAGVKEGSLRPLDPLLTFIAIMGLCEQFHYSLKLFDRTNVSPHETPQQAAARYKSFLYDLIFNGLATKPQNMSAPPQGEPKLARGER